MFFFLKWSFLLMGTGLLLPKFCKENLKKGDENFLMLQNPREEICCECAHFLDYQISTLDLQKKYCKPKTTKKDA